MAWGVGGVSCHHWGAQQGKPVWARQVPIALPSPSPPRSSGIDPWLVLVLPWQLVPGYPGGQCQGRAEETGHRKGKPPWFLSHSRDPIGKPRRSQKESGSSGPWGRPRNPHFLPEDGKSRVGLRAGLCWKEDLWLMQLSLDSCLQSRNYSGSWLGPGPDLTQPNLATGWAQTCSSTELFSQPGPESQAVRTLTTDRALYPLWTKPKPSSSHIEPPGH